MSNSNITIGFWLPTQVIMLVLYYGNILPSLPWWIVWFPSLIAIGGFVIVMALLIIYVVLSMIFGR